MTKLLTVTDLTVRFPIKKKQGLFGKKSYLTAVDHINFEVKKGETLAIVGESGSGKTTAALAIARLISGEAHGTAYLDDRDLLSMDEPSLKDMRKRIQVIFQDPYSSLNPRQRAMEIVQEPLDNLTDKTKSEKQDIVDTLFTAVGLRPEQKGLFPHQFSGGQRQRIGIARALSTQPDIIICDEPVSALDVAVQAQILNLLRNLQKKRDLTYLFISHDLGVVQHMCDSIVVMYMGKIVEYADRLSFFKNPQHPYSQALLSAVPSVTATKQKSKRIMIKGDSPDPLNLPVGCRFATRCPLAEERCKTVEPKLLPVTDQVSVACHLRH